MSDVTVDEIIDACPCITNKIIEYLENFLYSIQKFEHMIDGVLNFKDLISDANKIQEWLENYNKEVTDKFTVDVVCLERISEEIEELKVLQNSLHENIAENEKKVDILKGKLSAFNKKNESLADMRDEIQMYKLLTNTKFIYKGSNVSGYIAGKKIESFDMDPETLSKSDIINSLYNKVKNVSLN
ncbi:uncharacterized protein LOC108912832 [Anoplophora glabripennis]|uniref:uncharacterized protein LOC108912832 n=1 Tax=Anoplophora glabripennis TaxID=217634 RepID=UPI00087500B5|nr:uncharacterized protein LOC108912832 [Anoplophora glabripennis]